LILNHNQLIKAFFRTKQSPESLAVLSGRIVDEFELPPQFNWTNDDVVDWIRSLGFPQYEKTFRTNLINGRTLLLVDASALVKMNIKDFEHIKKITQSIREMYNVEAEQFGRSISLPPRHPETLYKFHRIKTGQIYEPCKRSDLFRRMKLMPEVAKAELNHFEKLYERLKHIPERQSVRIGGIKRTNLFDVAKGDAFSKVCSCKLPPCSCKYTMAQKRKAWRMSFLVEIEHTKPSDNRVCQSLVNLLSPDR